MAAAFFCQHCGRSFRANPKNANKFCSTTCYSMARDKRTADIKQRVIALRERGDLPQEIAAALGISSGKVAGILFRAQLTKPRLSGRSVPAEAPPGKPRKPRAATSILLDPPRPPARPVMPIPTRNAVHAAERWVPKQTLPPIAPAQNVVQIHTPLLYRSCQMPMNDGERRRWKFCDSPAVEPGKPYCLACCRVAYRDYVPAAQRIADAAD